ncbi:hypothetical protein LR48_Vigan03g088600 [Vigna angularis]|uniref:Uncharacterized protein n=1 Tax=Phaseolus angularis TaxID=3914 RepID=A0A0L9U538_PHAAN|nr:hypothetical protein LR48_Vigan03g088600 [Vigna angularis]
MIDKSTLHHMGLQHGQDRWLFKDEHAGEEEETASASSAPHRVHFEFEKHMVRQMHSLSVICQTIRQDVNDIKEMLQMNASNDEDEEYEENEEESEADESNDDMLTCQMKKK